MDTNTNGTYHNTQQYSIEIVVVVTKHLQKKRKTKTISFNFVVMCSVAIYLIVYNIMCDATYKIFFSTNPFFFFARKLSCLLCANLDGFFCSSQIKEILYDRYGI